MNTKIGCTLICCALALCACRQPHDGRDGKDGTNGLTGPAGINGSTPFSLDGSYSFPTTSTSMTIPGFDLTKGDVVNVYISWQGQPWTQIGSTWIGGMAGSYAVSGNMLTITTVIGPSAPLVQWAVNGIKND